MLIISHRDQTREEWRPGVVSRMDISVRHGATQLCIFEQWLEPNTGPPTHTHPVEEVLTVLEGKAEMWIDDERQVLVGGHSLVVPAGRPHGFRNVASNVLHMRAVLAAPYMEMTVEGSATPIQRGR
jgi:quercetin dioxygenase-like cupin family protein